MSLANNLQLDGVILRCHGGQHICGNFFLSSGKIEKALEILVSWPIKYGQDAVWIIYRWLGQEFFTENETFFIYIMNFICYFHIRK